MIVGVLTLDLAIYEAVSLKDKRRVIKSLKDRIAHRFNVSVAEVDSLDLRQRGVIGVAMVSNDTQYVDSRLRKIVDLVRATPNCSLIDFEIEFV